MIVRFLKPDSTSGTAKLTVHKTGKLGFSRAAMDLLQTERHRFARFGFDAQDQLLMEVSADEEESSFPIGRAGDYDYINAKPMLEDLEIDYTARQTVIFDLKRTAEKNIFRLQQRIIKK